MKQIIITIFIVIVLAVGALLISNGGFNVDTTNIENNSSGNITPTSQGDRLNLSSQSLTSVPSYVFGMTNLEELDVSHNNLTGAIQAEIRHLGRLKILNASYNSMTGVPAEVGQLQNLEILDLSYNQLTGLPYELGNLQNLKTLNLSGNNYSEQNLSYIRSKLPTNVNIITE